MGYLPLRYLWNIDIDDAVAHDAKGDVLVLEKVFERMIDDYIKIHSVSEEEAINKFIEISSNPVLLKKLSFGKHAGKTFKEIKLIDPSYFSWLASLTDKGEDFIFTIKHHLS